jgi:hypothetical protein
MVQADDGVDPHASSPAGAVYEIPLETARRDAAPHKKASQQDGSGQSGQSGSGGAGGGTPGGGASGGGGVLPQNSAIKSENGFGSSSHVPGLAAAKKGAKASAASATSAGSAGSSGPQGLPAVRAADGGIDPADAPSTGGSYGLVILIVLGGAAAGLVAATAVRRALGSAG